MSSSIVSNSPLVSVCIPTYNRRNLLEITLDSIANQTLRDFELLVCDDCSTDGTFEYLTSLEWPNLRVLRNSTNLNIGGTLERLFKAARGKYVGMQHDHDVYHPEFLEKMLALMEQNPTAGFGCCAFNMFGNQNQVIECPESWFELYPLSGRRAGPEVVKALATRVFTQIPAMGTMFRRETVEQAGGYRADWSIASDEDLYRRVSSISDVAFSRERLFTIRPRPSERHNVLGGWKAIYTLHEFRADTTKNYFTASGLRKSLNLARLRALRLKALLTECASLALRGHYEELESATRLDNIGALPRRPTLSPVERAMILIWSAMLKIVCSTFRPWIVPRQERRVG